MSTERETPARRSGLVSTWAPLGVVALVPLFLLFGRRHQIGDPDTFWHIRAGDYLLETWQFSGPDPWSPFTTKHLGPPRVAAGAGAVIRQPRRRPDGGRLGLVRRGPSSWPSPSTPRAGSQGRIVLSAIATVLALLGAAASLTPRPQLVSIALSAVVTAAWLSSARDGRARWWLVPLTWVWACSHGMWFVSPLVGGAVVLGLLSEPRPNGAATQARGRRRSRACSWRPSRPRTPLLLAPLSVSGYTRFVSEWDPPRLASPPVAVDPPAPLRSSRPSGCGPGVASRGPQFSSGSSRWAGRWPTRGRSLSRPPWPRLWSSPWCRAPYRRSPPRAASRPCRRRRVEWVDRGRLRRDRARRWPRSSFRPPPRPRTACRPASTRPSTGFPPAPSS